MAIAAASVIAGCTGQGGEPWMEPPTVDLGGELRLASFDSCDQALTELREAALPLVGAYGFGGDAIADRASGGAVDDAVPPGDPGAARPGDAASAAEAEQPDAGADPRHSTTNTHEAGVDEPDLVKTDGRRIVALVDNELQVVDAASRAQVGSLELPPAGGQQELLLSGDRALVIRPGSHLAFRAIDTGGAPPPDRLPGVPADGPIGGEVLLVDLSGQPTVLATFTIDGRVVDARMVGQTVRLVAHSQPRLEFVHPTPDVSEDRALTINQTAVSTAPIDDWLPRFRVEQGGSVQTGRVGCDAVARPADYSGTSMLTVLTFDLGAASLGNGDPISIVADGDTVYGTATSLYVASNAAWAVARRGAFDRPQPLDPADPALTERTELYKFDLTGSGPPRHVASGSVPGSLLNQYSMSEYDGHLRVATTVNVGDSASTVYVLAQRDHELRTVGQVGGLGKGERIYAVRFVGPVGYVVTFRQTDPLYTVDLREPESPKVTGELKITGYSAYLHPVDDGRLIGVGQEASEQGRVLGTQVSLFDVADPASPTRVAQYHLPGAISEAEMDPHAFLYWAPNRTLVLPVTSGVMAQPDPGPPDAGKPQSTSTALVLRVGDGELTEVTRIAQPFASPMPIQRTLVVGDNLWLLSTAGLTAHDLP